MKSTMHGLPPLSGFARSGINRGLFLIALFGLFGTIAWAQRPLKPALDIIPALRPAVVANTDPSAGLQPDIFTSIDHI